MPFISNLLIHLAIKDFLDTLHYEIDIFMKRKFIILVTQLLKLLTDIFLLLSLLIF